MSKAINRYYLFFGVMIALVVVLLGFTLSGASDAKQDSLTSKKFDQVVNGLNNKLQYGTASTVPDSLSAIGLKDVPKTITYQKLSTDRYKLCANYSSASSAFDGGWTNLLTGTFLSAFGGGYDPTNQPDSPVAINNDTYYGHKKGPNCQTIKLQPILPNQTTLPSSGSTDSTTST